MRTLKPGDCYRGIGCDFGECSGAGCDYWEGGIG
jgi:hypothetical protein